MTQVYRGTGQDTGQGEYVDARLRRIDDILRRRCAPGAGDDLLPGGSYDGDILDTCFDSLLDRKDIEEQEAEFSSEPGICGSVYEESDENTNSVHGNHVMICASNEKKQNMGLASRSVPKEIMKYHMSWAGCETSEPGPSVLDERPFEVAKAEGDKGASGKKSEVEPSSDPRPLDLTSCVSLSSCSLDMTSAGSVDNLDPFQSLVGHTSAEKANTRMLNSHIFAPGPRAEPPFEVALLHTSFSYFKGKDTSVFILKIASLYSSWIVIKQVDDIVGLVKSVKKSTDILRRVTPSLLLSLSPARREERKQLIELILMTVLNHMPPQRCIQSFVLTNALCIEEYRKLKTSTIQSVIKEDFMRTMSLMGHGGYLVEHRGLFRRWVCGFYQVKMGSLIRTSVNTGRVTEVVALRGHRVYSYTPQPHVPRTYLHAFVLEDLQTSETRIFCADDDETRDAFINTIQREASAKTRDPPTN